MPRPPRADVSGEIYHALNRGNGRMTVFRKDADYEAFERVLDEGLQKYPVDLIAYQWMPNHWHMVLSPREDGAMSRERERRGATASRDQPQSAVRGRRMGRVDSTEVQSGIDVEKERKASQNVPNHQIGA